MNLSYSASVDLPFVPVAAVRPKVTRWSTYYPGAYGEYLPTVREWLAANWSDDPLDGPLAVHLAFYLPRPKSHYGTGRNSCKVKGSAPAYPRPDLDNFVKGALDAILGTVIADDSLVVNLAAWKGYGDPGRTEIRIGPGIIARPDPFIPKASGA
jgi:Holliday junction resolvase RusA-like endonuclease